MSRINRLLIFVFLIFAFSHLINAATGDQNGDGTTDILWRNTNMLDPQGNAISQNWFYHMQSGQFTAHHLGAIHNRWQPYRGDFDGDGIGDILWRDTETGQNWMYLMNASGVRQSVAVNTVPLVWELDAIGDFDGDGKADIVWRHDASGVVWRYSMNGNKIIQSKQLAVVSDKNWQIVGAGDFNGDQTDDILWRHGLSGENYIYVMGNGFKVGGIAANSVSTAWELASLADLDGNGATDILWRNNETGLNWIYLFGAGKIQHSLPLNTIADLHWRVAESGDFDADGTDDLLWRHAKSGANYLYLMKQGKVSQMSLLNIVESADWLVDSSALPANPALNGQLRGRIFLGGDGDGWTLNLENGRYKRIPGVDWEHTQNNFPSSADFSITPTVYNGSERLVMVNDCERQSEAALAPWWDCMILLSEAGEEIRRTYIDDDIKNTPKLSPNGQLIAFFYHDAQFLSSPDYLVIMDRNMEILKVQEMPDNWASSLDWTPDGRVVFTHYRTLYITSYDWSTSTPLASFTEQEGAPSKVAVSPNGLEIAFLRVTDFNFSSITATPWVIGVNGQGLRQLADIGAANWKPSFDHPVWSPDGKWILLVHGQAIGDDPSSDVAGGAYAFPANSINRILSDTDPRIIRLRSYRGMTLGHPTSAIVSTFDGSEGSRAWLP